MMIKLSASVKSKIKVIEGSENTDYISGKIKYSVKFLS